MTNDKSRDSVDPDVPTEEDTKKHRKVKKRTWAFICYPESLPEDWNEKLMLSGIRAAVSPLHDKDTLPDGQKKKPHFHVILHYDGPVTFSMVSQFSREEMCGSYPVPLQSARGYYRYLTHKDHPKKYQYDEDEIQLFNSFDPEEFASLSSKEKNQMIKELTTYIFDNNVTEYAEFIAATLEMKNPDIFFLARTNTSYFAPLLNSMRHSGKSRIEQVAEEMRSRKSILMIDEETGEVLNGDESPEG